MRCLLCFILKHWYATLLISFYLFLLFSQGFYLIDENMDSGVIYNLFQDQIDKDSDRAAVSAFGKYFRQVTRNSVIARAVDR